MNIKKIKDSILSIFIILLGLIIVISISSIKIDKSYHIHVAEYTKDGVLLKFDLEIPYNWNISERDNDKIADAMWVKVPSLILKSNSEDISIDYIKDNINIKNANIKNFSINKF